MCYKIRTETLLLNFFAKSQKQSLSFLELEKIIADVKQQLNYSVIVDADNDALNRVANMHGSIFRFNSTYVELTKKECSGIRNEIQALQEAYDQNLPEYVKETYKNVFSRYEAP